jgi:hypothetical protein
MNKQETQRRARLVATLQTLGFTDHEAEQLRRISNTLQNWFGLECGTEQGHIGRDEKTDKPYFYYDRTETRSPVNDREKGAYKRLSAIMASRPHLAAYIQGDPRGAALYILRPDDVPAGSRADSCYTRGICVY